MKLRTNTKTTTKKRLKRGNHKNSYDCNFKSLYTSNVQKSSQTRSYFLKRFEETTLIEKAKTEIQNWKTAFSRVADLHPVFNAL